MIVCVDVGNTSTKVAAVESGTVTARASTPTGGERYRDRVAGALADVGAGPVAVSSVVPEATDDVVAAAAAPSRGTPLVVSHRLALPIEVAVPRPGRVGVDRLCAAAGVVDDAAGDAIIVDMGSAVTVDLVIGRRFLGGVIMPGPGMMLDAMAARARQLPRIDADALATLFPDGIAGTEDAMTLGAGLATVGGVLEAVRRLSARAPRAPVHVTGGWAPRLAPELPPGWRLDPDLCFRGLYRIALLNASQS